MAINVDYYFFFSFICDFDLMVYKLIYIKIKRGVLIIIILCASI
jgi:hypothetical protein